MAFPPQPQVKLTQTDDFRENYANSVQIHVSVWDFLLTFDRLQQQTPELVEFNCPQCDEPLKLGMELAGKRHPCPNCRKIIPVPVPKTQFTSGGLP